MAKFHGDRVAKLVRCCAVLLFIPHGAVAAADPSDEDWGLFQYRDGVESQQMVKLRETIDLAPRVSAGDRIEVIIPVDTEGLFSGSYAIDGDGTIAVPFLGAFPVEDRTVAEVSRSLQQALIADEYFLPGLEVDVPAAVASELGISLAPHSAVVARGRSG
ncbi:MAG: polysaccharide biosynthesis/export family protein, partial [Cyanobacteria bacterium J06639_1]